jgi:hypothetical protein
VHAAGCLDLNSPGSQRRTDICSIHSDTSPAYTFQLALAPDFSRLGKQFLYSLENAPGCVVCSEYPRVDSSAYLWSACVSLALSFAERVCATTSKRISARLHALFGWHPPHEKALVH